MVPVKEDPPGQQQVMEYPDQYCPDQLEPLPTELTDASDVQMVSDRICFCPNVRLTCGSSALFPLTLDLSHSQLRTFNIQWCTCLREGG
jgi:hypothetical protein